MIHRLVSIFVALSLFVAARAADARPNAEVEGRELAQKILEPSPSENSTISGVLKIRKPRSKTLEIPMQCRILVTSTNWQSIYETLPNTNSVKEQLVLTHSGTNSIRYDLNGSVVAEELADVPFAGSDFWLTDFGLEFLRWPVQRVLKKEIRRSRFCVVLESVRSSDGLATSQGYSRVVSWIDNETTGILHADAYDDRGRKLKEFEPKEFQKDANGQYQLQEMRIDNLQTGSRTTIEFDVTLSASQKP